MAQHSATLRDSEISCAQGFVTKDQMAGRLIEAVDALRNRKTFFTF